MKTLAEQLYEKTSYPSPWPFIGKVRQEGFAKHASDLFRPLVSAAMEALECRTEEDLVSSIEYAKTPERVAALVTILHYFRETR